MENKLNRLFVGIVLITLILIFYFLKLDYLFFFLISFFVFYECFNLKLYYDKIYLFFSILVFIFLNLFIYYSNLSFYYFHYICLIFVFLTFFLKHYLKFLFFVSLILFLLNIHVIHNIDRNYFYLIIFISFFNDTLAYIFGNLLKGPLIIPAISPKKTWSGTSLSFLFSFSLCYYFFNSFFYSIILASSLFLGDIYFSFIKRSLGIKDFSKILSDHGGILDRLDSIYLFLILSSFILI